SAHVCWARGDEVTLMEPKGQERRAGRGPGRAGSRPRVRGHAAPGMRYPMETPGTRRAHDRPRSTAAGDWLSGRAPRSHRGGHWFDPSIAHQARSYPAGLGCTLEPTEAAHAYACCLWYPCETNTDGVAARHLPGGL